MSPAVNAKRRTQAERREEAEGKLLRAAIELLATRGYDGFTLAEVGKAAGYSRGLPAHYFGCKEELLAADTVFAWWRIEAAMRGRPARVSGI